jgi:hypothetical protein
MKIESHDLAEIEFLKQQIELEQTNYRKALTLHVSFIILKAMREKMKLLKATLQLIIDKVNRTQSDTLQRIVTGRI